MFCVYVYQERKETMERNKQREQETASVKSEKTVSYVRVCNRSLQLYVLWARAAPIYVF